jgi:hypothetical protein
MTEETRIVGAAAFDGWAIVELMGHRIRAGRVTEVELAGGKMLRIDIPTEGEDVTEFYSTAAIYALRPCTEEIARRKAGGYNDPRPVRPLEYREREQAAIGHGDFDDM